MIENKGIDTRLSNVPCVYRETIQNSDSHASYMTTLPKPLLKPEVQHKPHEVTSNQFDTRIFEHVSNDMKSLGTFEPTESTVQPSKNRGKHIDRFIDLNIRAAGEHIGLASSREIAKNENV